MNSLSENTIKQYSSVIVEWINYCKSENICHFSAPIVKVVDFLTKEFNEGSKFGTLNSAKAAISNFFIRKRI